MVDALNKLSKDDIEFSDFCQYLKDVSGITISPSKAYLVSARVRQIMVDYDFKNLSDLLLRLRKNDRKLQRLVVDAMTTNETFWFRDGYPFNYFIRHLLPLWSKESSSQYRPIKVWSAACSTGQEPYSLAILFEEFLEHYPTRKKLDIIATDLSTKVLEQAKQGKYDKLSIGRGLSEERLKKYFISNCQRDWIVKENVKRHIKFESINLLDSFSGLGKFDIIFCRNVLIYFTKETKDDILTRMHRCLNPGGYLCLGSSESLGSVSPLFEMINCDPGLIYKVK